MLQSAKITRTNFVSTKNPATDPITFGDLKAYVPSLVAQEPHHSRSERSYGFVPTLDILMQLRERGFRIVQAQQQRTRDASKREFTKHVVRLRHVDFATVPELGGLIPEVAMLNSHDGSSQYTFDAGLMRLVCLNGMVVADESFGAVKVPHRKRLVEDVIDASFTVIENAHRAVGVAREWSKIDLNQDEQLALAEAVHSQRFEEGSEIARALPAPRLLEARRIEDRGNDLWRVTNRIQENVIKGGQTALVWRQGERQRRATTSREVKGIADNARLNKAIWALSAKMAEIRGA